MQNLLPPKLTRWLAENKLQIFFGLIFILASSGFIYAKRNALIGDTSQKIPAENNFSALDKISEENSDLKAKIASLEEQLENLEKQFSESQEFYKQDMEKINTAFNTVASNINKVASARIAGASTSNISALTGLSTDSGSSGSSSQVKGLININTASAAVLEQLPGIGPSKAQAIISHRQTIGKFTSKEQLKQVKGIGDATYQKLKDLITI